MFFLLINLFAEVVCALLYFFRVLIGSANFNFDKGIFLVVFYTDVYKCDFLVFFNITRGCCHCGLFHDCLFVRLLSVSSLLGCGNQICGLVHDVEWSRASTYACFCIVFNLILLSEVFNHNKSTAA